MVVGYIFTALEAFLKLVGLWEQFSAWYDAKKVADRNVDRQQLNKAVDDEVNAKTEQDFDNAQSNIVKHMPRP